jgi:hypothetical protein
LTLRLDKSRGFFEEQQLRKELSFFLRSGGGIGSSASLLARGVMAGVLTRHAPMGCAERMGGILLSSEKRKSGH